MISDNDKHCCCHGEGHSHEGDHCCHNHGHDAHEEHHCCHEHDHNHDEEHHCCCHGEGHGHGGGHCCHHHGGDAAAEAMSLYEAINKTLASYDTAVSDEKATHTAAQIIEKHAKENDTEEVKRFLLSTVELTSLKVTDNDESILAMVEKVNHLADNYPDVPNVAAVCTYPNYASMVSESLEPEDVSVTCVAGGFPSAQMRQEIKCVEVSLALKDGADEIDTVLHVGKFLDGDYEYIVDELGEMREFCGPKKFKIILETGALQSAENIKKAAVFAMYCGADFIKTSTGKISVGATPMAVYIMCCAIKEYFEKTGTKIGIKVAGGVKTVADAVGYYTIVREVLGDEWLTPDLFRIGASGLANALLSDILGKETIYF